jgi:hypothetical protein
VYLESGYKTITPIQLCNALSALDESAITYRAFRIYIACFSLQAAREAASRVRRRAGRRGEIPPRYTIEELMRLVHGTGRAGVLRDLGRLRRAGLILFSERAIDVTAVPLTSSSGLLERAVGSRSPTRPIPVPRSMLRFLAGCTRPVLAKTIAAYLLRGLSIDRRSGEVNGKGTVKLSWVAETFGVSERAARYARAELVGLGWIGRDVHSYQRKLNRDGAYFEINLSWRCPGSAGRCAPPNVGNPGPGESRRTRLDTVPASAGDRTIAARRAKTRPEIAPPLRRPETPNGFKDQGTRRAEPPGVSTEPGGRKPTLRDVRVEDLRCFRRTEELYWQAVETGLITHSETNALNWLGAAVRATSVDGDAARVFVGIVRRGLWTNTTHEQEERARRALVRYREKEPGRFRTAPGGCLAPELTVKVTSKKPYGREPNEDVRCSRPAARGGRLVMIPVREVLLAISTFGEGLETSGCRCPGEGPPTPGGGIADSPGRGYRYPGEIVPIAGGESGGPVSRDERTFQVTTIYKQY